VVQAVSVCNGSSIDALGSASANWLSANTGFVNFENLGWVTSNVSQGEAALFRGVDFSYSFIADADDVLTLASLITGRGTDLFGLVGFYVLGPGGTIQLLHLKYISPYLMESDRW
jgi:hypothetical protein